MVRRTQWQLQEIEKAQDGTFNLFYNTPDGGRKVRCCLWHIKSARLPGPAIAARLYTL